MCYEVSSEINNIKTTTNNPSSDSLHLAYPSFCGITPSPAYKLSYKLLTTHYHPIIPSRFVFHLGTNKRKEHHSHRSCPSCTWRSGRTAPDPSSRRWHAPPTPCARTWRTSSPAPARGEGEVVIDWWNSFLQGRKSTVNIFKFRIW